MHRRFRLITQLLLLSAAIAATPLGLRELRTYLRQDAFSEYRKPSSNSPIGIRMEGVHFHHFRDTKLTTYADADEIEVTRGRDMVLMTGIHDGVFREGDRTFRYEAKNARWDANRLILSTEGGVRIRHPKLELRSRHAIFNTNKKLITAEGGVNGNLMGGQLYAHHLVYNTEKESYRAGPVSWKGKLPAEFAKQEPQVASRRWKFNAEFATGTGSDQAVYTNAMATDDEVIVIAPKITHIRKTDEIICEGTEQARIQYFSAKANLVASRVHVFRKEKRALFTGNVLMLVKPKKDQQEKPKVEALPAFQPLLPEQVKADPPPANRPDEEVRKDEQVRDNKTIRDYPMVVTSASIEYWYGRGSRRAVITGNPQGRQELGDGKWRHLWTNVGFYDGEKEELKLVSTQGRKDTRMKNSVGDDAIADWMLVSTKEEDDRFSFAGLIGDFADLSGDDDPRDKKTPPPAGNNPPPKSGSGRA